MPLNPESLDDPMQIDACPGFGMGQRSYGPPDQLQAQQAAELVNVDIRDGTATTRRGTSLFRAAPNGSIQGMAWFDTPTQEKLVIASGGTSYYDNGTGWTAASGYNPPSGLFQVCYAQLVDTLFAADAVNVLQRFDGTSWTTAGGGLPVCSIIITATNRLWAAGYGAIPDALYASAPLNGNSWDTTNLMIRIGGGEGDPITGLAELDNFQIVVFKRNSIYIVRADPSQTDGSAPEKGLTNAVVTKVSDVIGCVSHRSIARVGNDVWFLSDGGVFSVGRVQAQTERELTQALSEPVQDVIDRINWLEARSACAVYWNNRYFLALPLDDAAQPSTVLVFNTQRGAWSGLWTWQPVAWCITRASGGQRVVFGRARGDIWTWLDYVSGDNEVDATFQDAGTDYETRVVSRAMIFNEAVCTKNLLNLAGEFFRSLALVEMGVRLDEQTSSVLDASFQTSPGSLLLNFTLPALLPSAGLKRRACGGQHLPRFRSIQATAQSAGGKLSLRAFTATGFINTITLESR